MELWEIYMHSLDFSGIFQTFDNKELLSLCTQKERKEKKTGEGLFPKMLPSLISPQ